MQRYKKAGEITLNMVILVMSGITLASIVCAPGANPVTTAYRYKQRVTVVEGFYVGYSGVVLDNTYGAEYTLQLDDGRWAFRVPALQLKPEETPQKAEEQ